MQLAPPPTLSDLTADAHAGSFLHDYLQSVYREHLPKVVHGGASGFIWFYHRLVGLNVSCRQPQTWRFQRSLCCPPLNSSASLCALHRDQPQPVTPLNRWGYWLPTLSADSCDVDALQQEPLYAADDTWIEVIRLAARRFSSGNHVGIEGGVHGCWFLAAKGSGVFINTGRSLRVLNRSTLAIQLGLRNETITDKQRLTGCIPGTKLFDEYPYCFENVFDLCSLVRLRLAPAVYDTIQIWEERYSQRKSHRGDGRLFELEVISCDDGCVSMPPKTFAGPCVPIPMRTGWKADKHCACNDTIDVLNCVDTAPHISLPSPTLEPDKHGNKSIIKSHELSAFQALPLCTSIFHRAWLP